MVSTEDNVYLLNLDNKMKVLYMLIYIHQLLNLKIFQQSEKYIIKIFNEKFLELKNSICNKSSQIPLTRIAKNIFGGRAHWFWSWRKRLRWWKCTSSCKSWESEWNSCCTGVCWFWCFSWRSQSCWTNLIEWRYWRWLWLRCYFGWICFRCSYSKQQTIAFL